MKRVTLPSLLLLLLAAPASSEVSVTRLSDGSVEFFFSPADAGPWTQVRSDVPAADLLNGDGDLDGDSWPKWLANPASGRPDVVWSSGGQNREIRFSSHDGESWSQSLNLSQAAGNDELPELRADEFGNRFVAWTRSRNGGDLVLFVAIANDGEGVSEAHELSDRNDDARRAVLAVHDTGEVFVAYEETHNGQDPVVYLAVDRITVERDDEGVFAHSGERPIDIARCLTIPTAAEPGAFLAPQVHVENGRLWVDWIDSVSAVGWIELDGDVFTSPASVSIDAVGGEQEARDEVRNQVLD